MLRRLDAVLLQAIAGVHRRQAGGVLVLGLGARRARRDLRFVPPLLIGLEEAVETHDLPGGAEVELARRGLGENLDRGAFELRALHLAGDRALPDQVVELELIVLEMALDVFRPARHVGRADRLVRLLRVLRLGHVLARARRHIGVAIFAPDHLARRRHRLGREIDAVGAHIGNESDRAVADVDALVKPLRDLHGARRGEAELARGLLLQRRGGEGRLRMALDGLGLDRDHGEAGGSERRLEGARLLAGADVEPADLPAVRPDEPRGEGGVGGRLEMRDERPVLARDEFLDLELAVADDAQRHRLHPPRRARAGQLSPQHRRQVEADEIIERAAGEIGVDQRLVDLARVAHRLLHGLFRHRVEHDAVDALVLQELLVLEDFVNVPGYRLALAVGVGGQNHAVGVLDRHADLGKSLGGLGVDFPFHREVVVGIDRAVLGFEVADVAERGVNVVILA